MKKYFFLFIIICSSVITSHAQDCGVGGVYGAANKPNDNFLEVKLTASEQDGYYVCRVELKRPLDSIWLAD